MERIRPNHNRPWRRWICAASLCLLTLAPAFAAETIPPKPQQYFNDYAQVTSPATREQLNSTLEALEKSDSTQIIVAVFPKMESDSSLEDYTVRVARAWGVGQAATNNGAILFVFVQDRAMRIEVGYGLEGAIPDALAKRIIEEQIAPHFRAGNLEQGLAAGVQALVQAARGEYQGTGRTVGGARRQGQAPGWLRVVVPFFILFAIIAGTLRRRRGYAYGRGGRRMYGGPFMGGFGGGGGGGGGFGGGFSGGGGSFGGGGASGRW